MRSQSDLSHEILTQAADWFALLRSGNVSEQERQALQHWLDAHADHRRSWQFVESIEASFVSARAAGTHQAEQTLRNLRQRRASRRSVLSGLALLVGAGTLGWHYTSLPHAVATLSAQHRTAVGEVKSLTLADGSQVWLNTDTALNTDFSGANRRLELLKGELLIETGKADARPLIVATQYGTLRPLGTRFTVRDDGEQGFLAVFDGAVEIQAGSKRQVIQARQQTRYQRDYIAPIQAANRARESWHQGLLLAEDIRLQDLARELERYRSGYISVAPEVADLRVFGGYPVNDPDRALAMLEKALPIRVQHSLPWWVSIGAAP